MKYNLYILSLIMICLMSSCEDVFKSIDDLEPSYKLTEENAYTDAGKVEAALAGLYATWRIAGGSYLPGNIMSLSGNMADSGGSDYNTNTVADDNGDNVFDYDNYYKLIQGASFLIDNIKGDQEIQGLEDARRKEIEAEARLSRAMCHFGLLELYGQFYDLNSQYGIVTRMVASREYETPARSTVQQSYDAILEDLNFAVDHAPVISVHHKFSQTTAKAIKAKVLLYMKDYTKAAALALEVMGDPNHALQADYNSIFAAGHSAQEVLFAPYSVAWTQRVLTYVDIYYEPLNITDIADAEVDDIVDGGGNVVEKRYDTRYTYAFIEGMPLGISNQKYRLINPVEEGDKSNTFIKMRMAEVYLIYAEAIARDGDASNDNLALERVNELRDRVSMPHKSAANNAELLEVIRTEKNLELFAEGGQPWFDMIRYYHNDIAKITAIKPTITSVNQLILPIPRASLAGNSGLVQNPGYEVEVN